MRIHNIGGTRCSLRGGLTGCGIVALVMVVALSGCRKARRYDQAQLSPWQKTLNVDSFDTIWKTIRDQHWDKSLGGVDWEGARERLRPQVAEDATMADARRTMADLIGQLGSSHFAVIPTNPGRASDRAASGSDETLAKVAPAIQDAMQRLDRGDTGIVVRVLDGEAVVVEVFPKSPAAVLGVKPGWVVQSIDGKPVEGIIERVEDRFEDRPVRRLALARSVQSRLLGPTGDKVELGLLNDDDKLVQLDVPFGVPRGHKTRYGLLPPIHVWSESKVLDDGTVYFRMNAFLDPPEVMPALEAAVMNNLDAPGFVLDLRGNQGGISAMARGIAGWFIRDEDRYLGTVEMRDLTLRFAVAPRPTTYDGPLAVLVDGVSASTSEILAAGLRDLGRARVFGTSTAAAALPSLVRKLPNGDRFQHAVANYVSLGGETLEGSGIVPDEVVPVTRAALLAGDDPVLGAARNWIRVRSGLPTLEADEPVLVADELLTKQSPAPVGSAALVEVAPVVEAAPKVEAAEPAAEIADEDDGVKTIQMREVGENASLASAS